jgi:hypothetical protein
MYTYNKIQDCYGKIDIKQEGFFFTMKLNLRKKLAKCCIWSIALYSNQSVTLARHAKLTYKIGVIYEILLLRQLSQTRRPLEIMMMYSTYWP